MGHRISDGRVGSGRVNLFAPVSALPSIGLKGISEKNGNGNGGEWE